MQDVEDLNLAYSHEDFSGKVTVSLGGSTQSPSLGCKSDDFFDAADDMLGLAKKSGKNRILWKLANDRQVVVE
jgi:PleD family two-component response regulator